MKSDNGKRKALNLAAGALWYLPGSFAMASCFGPRYSLRCVLFHDISDTESSFTKGLGITITRKNFEAALRFIRRHYTPVSLEDILTDCGGQGLPPRPVLVTFDDAYRSVPEFAAPLCAELGVPAVFFVNGVCLDNKQLALDNLVCYVANAFGLDMINAGIRSVTADDFQVRSLAEAFSRFLPTIPLARREAFRKRLLDLAEIKDRELAEQARLYLTSKQLHDLAGFNFEIGNHTYTHVHCRTLSVSELGDEIDRNKAALKTASGTNVRSFSIPYGLSLDLTADLAEHLHCSGHEAVFLAEGCANTASANQFALDRISITASTNSAFFSEIEILPRLRTLRNVLFGPTKRQKGIAEAGLAKPRVSEGIKEIRPEIQNVNTAT
jgi:peptidoglycan/xylan/chitin deacetylase (PgdA/CDA1 family)